MLFKKKKNHSSVKKLESLYSMYSKLLYGIAYDILQEPEAAEDAVHETFVRLIGSADKISEDNSAATRNFLAIICRNIAINIYNSRKKENERIYAENELFPVISDTYNPESILISKESVDAIIKSLENLDRKYRDVVLLSRVYKSLLL